MHYSPCLWHTGSHIAASKDPKGILMRRPAPMPGTCQSTSRLRERFRACTPCCHVTKPQRPSKRHQHYTQHAHAYHPECDLLTPRTHQHHYAPGFENHVYAPSCKGMEDREDREKIQVVPQRRMFFFSLPGFPHHHDTRPINSQYTFVVSSTSLVS